MIDMTQLEKWQTLIGSALGPFLAILLTAFGFVVKRKLDDLKERKENLRYIEVMLTDAINTTYNNKRSVDEFIRRLGTLVTEIRATPPSTYCIAGTSYPYFSIIDWGDKMTSFRTRSLYLHNKLLGINMGMRSNNVVLMQLKDDFAYILQQNQFLVAEKADFASQINIYATNIQGFAATLNAVSNSLKTGIETMAQAKIYNQKIKRNLFWHSVTTWWYEGRSFKYFKNYKNFHSFNQHPRNFKRIDAKTKKECIEFLAEAERDYE